MAPKPKTSPPAQHRPRSADEMRGALAALRLGGSDVTIPPNYDEPGVILEDTIEELLTLRQLRADVLAFMQDQQVKLQRR